MERKAQGRSWIFAAGGLGFRGSEYGSPQQAQGQSTGGVWDL